MRLGRNVLEVFGTNFLTLILSLGNSIFLTRVLGVVGRGEFAVFSASFGILSLLLGLGLDISLRYHVARGDVPRERILSSLLVYALAAGSVVYLAAHLDHRYLDNELFLPRSKRTPAFELVLAGIVAANLVYANLSSVFAGRRAFRAVNVASVFFALVSLGTFGALWAVKATGWGAVGSDLVFVVYLGLQVFNAAVLTALAFRQLGVRPSLQLVHPALVRTMLGYASVAWLSTLLQFLNYRLDIWIVQYFRGTGSLGLYALAANLAMVFWMLPRAASTVLLPTLVSSDEGAETAAAARLGRLVFVGTVVLAAPLAVLSPWWIDLLYGSEFRGAAAAFAVLLVGCAPYTLCIVQTGVLSARARLDVTLAASAAGLAVTVVLDLLLIPPYGIMGAAIASAVSYLVTTAVVVSAFARLERIPLRACTLPQRGDVDYVTNGLQKLLR